MHIIDKTLLKIRSMSGGFIFLNHKVWATGFRKRNELWDKNFTLVTDSINATSFACLGHSSMSSCKLPCRFSAT